MFVLVCRGENPYDAADRFLEQEGLPITYRCGQFWRN